MYRISSVPSLCSLSLIQKLQLFTIFITNESLVISLSDTDTKWGAVNFWESRKLSVCSGEKKRIEFVWIVVMLHNPFSLFCASSTRACFGISIVHTCCVYVLYIKCDASAIELVSFARGKYKFKSIASYYYFAKQASCRYVLYTYFAAVYTAARKHVGFN